LTLYFTFFIDNASYIDVLYASGCPPNHRPNLDAWSVDPAVPFQTGVFNENQMTQKEKFMSFPEAATLFSRCKESGLPQGAPELPGPVEYGSCLTIVKAMDRIMAEHFGIPRGPKKRLTRRRGKEQTREQNLSPSPRHPFPESALPSANEGSRRYE
jgi:hypothetical protein